jgi:hypothetical protein
MFTAIINLYNALVAAGFVLNYDATGECLYSNGYNVCISVYLTGTQIEVLTTDKNGEENNQDFAINDAAKALLFIDTVKRANNDA